MQQIPHTYQTLYSELAQRSLDASFSTEFNVGGRFVTAEVKGRRYWYLDLPNPDGGKTRTYVGPVDDPEITRRVENFKDLKADIKERRKLVSTLIREAYLPRPERKTGDIVQALAEAGFFRLRGVLVGTVAYQCYPAILGVRLPSTSMVTGDADFAQFHSISTAVDDRMPPVLDTLRKVDPTFREIPHQADGRFTTQYSSRSGYKVEFLTPNTGSADYEGRPTTMPALGGASAQPLRFLDFLIYEPIRAVLLHGAGVPVNVPSPERYAIHKLIVASRRRTDSDGTAKSRKDRMQAATIMEAMIEQRQSEDLADAFMEAYDRGPAWKDAIRKGLSQVDDDARETVLPTLARAIRKLERDPSEFDLEERGGRAETIGPRE
ncbi:nucleotidyltransferase family protein [Mesorhizobium wenxiniae]|uniref:Nucleotidyltransferase-like domain-containing protein n=1 Tax=Mesorhizobium wenxiniae TaxID=2014805 RepID=A0A271KAC5_9HYPH|nr:GSU2403 family nucleotidyltransferase fold protein [Mesorhizobium wenxiniae]PAP92718.1 hypothetical protein CIT31_25795 [Mesorhizobium wenxiniae]